jgi:hypothetical protein
MQKIIIALAIALALPATAKPAAVPKDPPPAVLAHAADICKATGGFGRVFGRGYGQVDATASEDWAPFEQLSIGAGEIVAQASFHGAADTLEGDVAKAEAFLKSLDKAVTAKAKFPHRETSGNRYRYSGGKEPGTGVTLELNQDREIVVAICRGG